MTSLTAWERSLLYASCSQVLVALQHLSHCSCWEALLFSRNSLGTLRYIKVHLVSAARQNQLGHGNSMAAFPLLSQSLEVQGKLVWYGYVPLLSVKCLTCTPCCLKRPIWKEIIAARLGRGIKPATSYTSLQDLSSDPWTFCLCLLCFEDHALYLHLNILYFAHLKCKFFSLPPAFTPVYIYVMPNIYASFVSL